MNSSELQVDFLIKASSAVARVQNDETQQILRSFYLLRCNQVTRISNLPRKHFSYEARCPRCLLEWTKGTEQKVTPIKLSKRQRRRIRSNGKLKKKSGNKEYLLHSDNMEKVCSFCSHTTITPITKPSKSLKHIVKEEPCVKNPKILKKQNKKEKSQKVEDKFQSNVYCESKEVFSMSKQSNTLHSHIKEPAKIIKNKRKKDKYAGLSRAAVIAATKIKEEKVKQSKLSLFLKPSN